MRVVTTVLLHLLLPAWGVCQISLAQQVFASGGSAGQRESGTMGEAVIFGISQQITVCQGFQTGASFFLSNSLEGMTDPIKWTLKPVPAATEIHVTWSVEFRGIVELLSMDGKVQQFWQIPESSSSSYLELARIPSGEYILMARSHDTKQVRSAKIIVHE